MYPFGPRSSDITFPKNDYESYRTIRLNNRLIFFNKVYTKMFVYTNGLISFLSPINKNYSFDNYTPISTPLISPFWSDKNIIIGGQIYFRESFCSLDLNKAKSDIASIYSTTFNPLRLYIITWDQVAAYNGYSSLNNTFQVIIATDGNLSFLVFNFGIISWPNSQFRVNLFFGYNAGNNINYYSYPDSFTNNITNVAVKSNVNIPGKWIFIASTNSSTLSTTRTTLASGSLIFNLLGNSTVFTLTTLPNGNLASSSGDSTIKIWNPNTGSLVYTLTGHTSDVLTSVILPNGNLASSSADNTVKIWNPNTGSLLYTLTGHQYEVLKLATLSNGNLASCSYDSTVKIWNPNAGALVYTLTGHTSWVTSLVALQNGNLASGSEDSTIKIWDPNTGTLIYTLTGHTSWVTSLVTLLNGNLATGSTDSTIKIWDPNTGTLVYSLIEHSGGVKTLVILSNGNLVSGSEDSTIKIWDPNTGTLIYTLKGHTNVVYTLATLPNGNLASGSYDMTVKIWDPNTGSLLYTLTGHTDIVYTLATLPNGNLASGSLDKTVKIWAT